MVKLRLVLVLGSVREERNGERVARYVSEQLASKGHTVHILDPQEIKLPLLQAPLHHRKEKDVPTVMSEANRKIEEADAVVFIPGNDSPEYNRSAPPALTNFLDHFPPSSFSFKPTAIFTYSIGFYSGVVCAQQLVTLMCELGSPAVPNPVSIPQVHENFTESGKTSNSHIIDNVEKYIQKLEWYAEALKEQKKKEGTV